MTTLLERPPEVSPLPDGMSSIDVFTEADACRQPGEQLRLVREAAARFRQWFPTTGMPSGVDTRDLVTLPYPTRFGLFRAHLTPVPFLAITNRMIVVRWLEPDGRPRVLLFEPSDVELGRRTPYFARLAARMPSRVERLSVTVHGDVVGQLASVGVRPEDVDYLTFDHLHTQDVRRWVGTLTPQPDISPDRPLEPVFPRARLVVQRSELEALRDLHPLQRPWYQPDTYADLRPDAVLAVEGDVLLGPGVALLATPGHTIGNHSLVLNTREGIWASSENVIAAECLTPEHSRIPGVRRHADAWGQELILNANTIENTAQQYNSCVKEKSIVDRSARDARFLQFFPSSELTRSLLNPGTAPTFVHGALSHRA